MKSSSHELAARRSTPSSPDSSMSSSLSPLAVVGDAAAHASHISWCSPAYSTAWHCRTQASRYCRNSGSAWKARPVTSAVPSRQKCGMLRVMVCTTSRASICSCQPSARASPRPARRQAECQLSRSSAMPIQPSATARSRQGQYSGWLSRPPEEAAPSNASRRSSAQGLLPAGISSDTRPSTAQLRRVHWAMSSVTMSRVEPFCTKNSSSSSHTARCQATTTSSVTSVPLSSASRDTCSGGSRSPSARPIALATAAL
mmetsp:Transcript_42154/g.107794  ORF Transcript_42154/g.107794 Transcript_42154/m.107794 type:complete len:257 (+) Transcript_42154:1356-2126(+)